MPKINKYWVKPKKRHNKTYRKVLTKHNKKIRDKRILMYMLAWFVFTATYAFIDISNNFVISCDEVVKATSIATPKRVESETALLEQVLPVMIETEKSNEMQIREIAREFDFKWIDWLVKLAFCESSLNQYAVGDNGNSRGLFQIHKGYHPNVTDEQAFNIRFSTIWTMNKVNNGKQHLWSCDRIIKNR